VLPPDIQITSYAWMRFVTRQGVSGELPPCLMTELKRILAIAHPEKIGVGAVLRLLNNNMEPAAYFEAENWRIVTDEDMTRVITFERALVGRKKKGKYRKPWWR
jgi:hypothetical protein